MYVEILTEVLGQIGALLGFSQKPSSCAVNALKRYKSLGYRVLALGIWQADFLWYSTGSKFIGQTQFDVKGTYTMLVMSSTTFKKSGFRIIWTRIVEFVNTTMKSTMNPTNNDKEVLKKIF